MSVSCAALLGTAAIGVPSVQAQSRQPSSFASQVHARSAFMPKAFATTQRIDNPGNGKGADGRESDFLGYAVAIDGNTAVVGATGDDRRMGARQEGAAYVFINTNGQWQLQQKLTGASVEQDSRFGSSVAVQGDSILIGAPGELEGAVRGAAYSFSRSAGQWTRRQRLARPDQPEPAFGSAVALTPTQAFVGASSFFQGSGQAGFVGVYDRQNGEFVQRQTLTSASDVSGSFGMTIATDGVDLVVAAPYQTVSGQANHGLAEVFELQSGLWLNVHTLRVENVGATVVGSSIAVGAARIVLGSQAGFAYPFLDTGGAWIAQAPLRPADYVAGSRFGVSVSLSGDFLVIGAPEEGAGPVSRAGAAYVFEWVGTWQERQKLVGANRSGGDIFGWSVATSSGWIIAGVPADSSPLHTSAGSASVWTRPSSTWIETAQLVAGPGGAIDLFGATVVSSSNSATVAVGAFLDDVGVNFNQGSVHVAALDAGVWTLQGPIVAPDGAPADYFGLSLALAQGRLVVGAPDSDVDGISARGAVYTFVAVGAGWNFEQKLIAADGALVDQFGTAVALGNDVIFVGAPRQDSGGLPGRGCVYVFERMGSTWTQTQRLRASDGMSGDGFGTSISLSGDSLAIGAPADELRTGAAYVFVRNGLGEWVEQQKVSSTEVSGGAKVGEAIALDADTLVLSATGDGAGTIARGSALVFQRVGSLWSMQQKIAPSTSQAFARFSESLALKGNVLAVGSNSTTLAVHLYRRVGASWTESQTILPLAPSWGDSRPSVALTGNHLVVGNGTAVGLDEYANEATGAVRFFNDDPGLLMRNGFEP